MNNHWFDSDFFQSTSFVLESFYYLSGIALFCIGIYQIKSVFTTFKKSNERQAKTLSVELCEKFYKELISLIDELDDEIRANGLVVTESTTTKSNVEITCSSKRVDSINNYMRKNPEFKDKFLRATNLFEAFSSYFVHEIADSKTAFDIIAIPYCACVRTLMPLIVFANKDVEQDEGYFPNIRELYPKWGKLILKNNMDKQLKSLEKDNIKHPNPIGT